MNASADRNPSTRTTVELARGAVVGVLAMSALGAGIAVAADSGKQTGTSITAVTPFRAYDSRLAEGGTLSSGETVVLDVLSDTAGNGIIPTTAKAVYFNVTVAGVISGGWLSVNPGDIDVFPNTSTVNFREGDVVANASMVALPAAGSDAAGTVSVTAGGGASTEFVIDVVGYVE